MIKVFTGILIGLIFGLGFTRFYYESVISGQFHSRNGQQMLDSHTLLLSRDSNNIQIDDLVLYDFCLNHKKMKTLIHPDVEWNQNRPNFIAKKVAVKKAEWYLSFIPKDNKYLAQCENVAHL
ncbi:hypothetical protein P886_3436 [Alteromonadaceae bacterium 2753L.S.0a.02]|nr:hypothetical protein P886_3436 [Alteromonadaceae bacterium 2753L.S.0a.02]